MIEALHGGMLLTSACGLGCSPLLEKRVRVPAIAAGVVMFVAMLDMSAGHLVLAAPSWAVVLILTGAATTLTQLRLQPGQPVMALHRGGGAILVAALLLATHPLPAMPVNPQTHSMAAMSMADHGPTHPGPLLGVALGYVLASSLLAVRHARGNFLRRVRTADFVDVVTMAGCVALMGVTALA